MKGRRCDRCNSHRTEFLGLTPPEITEELMEEYPEAYPEDFDPRAHTVDGTWHCNACGNTFTALGPGLYERDRYRLRSSASTTKTGVNE